MQWLNSVLLEMWPFYDYAISEMVKVRPAGSRCLLMPHIPSLQDQLPAPFQGWDATARVDPAAPPCRTS